MLHELFDGILAALGLALNLCRASARSRGSGLLAAHTTVGSIGHISSKADVLGLSLSEASEIDACQGELKSRPRDVHARRRTLHFTLDRVGDLAMSASLAKARPSDVTHSLAGHFGCV